ncbi:hypothetical protein PYW08_005009 [Mythimna loreyi]|uniref:Uncharacterized protein n=1 Tax=Mythimna loreyi TaxID=667449 RepID=A0ACC2QIW6_9NEOP|nr:hypothetical protein PYW08_005009 [Mythimna loreyi]
MSSQQSSISTSRKTAAGVSTNLRKKILKNTTKSVVSEKAAHPSEPPQYTVPVPKASSEPLAAGSEVSACTTHISDTTPSGTEAREVIPCRVSETVINWEQCGISPPRQIISDDESSVASSAGHLNRLERQSILYRTPRRGTGVEMDLATREANDLLQRGKDALESAGKMKRECKVTAHECLQGLYETVLSLADSRARHKFNLEKERSRHAQELVRVERAHTRDVMTLKTELSLMRTDLTDTKKEAKGIRDWLGHETLEAFKSLKEVREEVKLASFKNSKEHEQTRVDIMKTPGDPKGELLSGGLFRLESQVTSISNQLDVLRQEMEKLKSDPTQPGQDLSQTSEAGKDILTNTRFDEEMERMRVHIQEMLTKSAPSPPLTHSREDLHNHLKPIAERLDLVSADIRVLRDKEPPTQIIATPNLDAELAVVEVKQHLQNIEKGVAELGKVDRQPQQQQGPKTFAQVVKIPKPPPKPNQLLPNHTLIISSTDPKHTGDNVIERIKAALDFKTTGAKVDAVRKARNQKVILRCASKADLNLVRDQFKKNEGLKVQESKPQNPLVCVKGVLSSYSNGEIVDLLLAQNKHLLQDVAVNDQTARVRYRKRARNPHECHPVLELSPKMWLIFTQAQRVHVGIKRCSVVDQSPLVQCTKCLGYGHNRSVCGAAKESCFFCSGAHDGRDCQDRAEGKEPTCINCKGAQKKGSDLAHTAFSEDCQERQKWDGIARSRVSYC